jgi:oxalate decarboxylase family bicupin protein
MAWVSGKHAADFTVSLLVSCLFMPRRESSHSSMLSCSPLLHNIRDGIQEPVWSTDGTVRITAATTFPVSTTIAAALVEVEPSGMREMHWHPTNDEWHYYLEGSGRMTVFASGGKVCTFDYQAGDVGSVPFAIGHYVVNTGSTRLRFLELF